METNEASFICWKSQILDESEHSRSVRKVQHASLLDHLCAKFSMLPFGLQYLLLRPEVIETSTSRQPIFLSLLYVILRGSSLLSQLALLSEQLHRLSGGTGQQHCTSCFRGGTGVT